MPTARISRWSPIAFLALLWIALAAPASTPPSASGLAGSELRTSPGRVKDHVGEAPTAQGRGQDTKGSGRGADRRGKQNRRGKGKSAREVRVPPGARVLRDLEYAQVEGESLQLDLYLPEEVNNHGRLPLLVWIHGGGWTRGDKGRINPVFVKLVPEGYATASINYRLVGVARHPRQLHDVKGAIRWLRAQADRFGYDANRIGLGGGSAGGHLALLAGLTSDRAELEGDIGGNLNTSSKVQATVSFFGPSDLEKLTETRPRFAQRKSPQLLRSASPLTYVGAEDPPLLVFHGDQDAKVTVDQSQHLHERYKAAGLVSDLHVIEGAGHGGKAFKNARTRALVKEFLDRHLRPQQVGENKLLAEARIEQPTNQSVLLTNSFDQQHSQAQQRMHGFHWMIGPRNGLDGTDKAFERLLVEVDRNLAENACITGVFVIQPWDLLEPEPKDYRFERLERLLATVRKHGRYYKLAINPGINSPDWLYAQGAEAFETLGSNPARRDIYQKKIRIPVPWDPHYQNRYYQLLGEVSRRFGADSAFRAMTVTAATFMSAEWHLPRSEQDRKRWSALEGFPQRLQEVWTNGIDRYSKLFPKQVLVLHASSYPIGLKDLGESVVHHGATHYPGRFAVQINQLNGRYDLKQRPTYKKLLEYRRRYADRISIGLQNLKSWSFPEAAKKQGSREMTTYNYVQANGEYWELWYGDGKDPETCQTLRSQRDKALGMGLAAFRKALEEKNEYVADPGRRGKH